MTKRVINIPRGYDPKTQAKIGLFAGQLDDQLKWLKKQVAGLTVKQLEWQLKPGMNTVGMLLAHLALVEVWWIKVAPQGLPWDPDGKRMLSKICGIEDDGMPLKPKGVHPEYLRKLTLDDYLKTLGKARRSIHRELKTWRDRDLDRPMKLFKHEFTKTWILYHVLEHFASHFGQVLLLMHFMRDAGVLKPGKK